MGGGDEALRFPENRESDMGGETRTEPERPQLIRAGRRETETGSGHVRELLRNLGMLDQFDLAGDEVDESLDVDLVLRSPSFRLLI